MIDLAGAISSILRGSTATPAESVGRAPGRASKRVGALLSIAGLLASGSIVAAEVSGATTTEFQVPAASLADALSKFGAQSGMQIVYAPELARGLKSAAMSGRLTIDAALEQLLAGTGLTWSYVNGNTVVLKRADQTRKSSAAAEREERRTQARGRQTAKQGDLWDRETVTVTGKRPRPFTDANVDIPRTMNDVQPYYIFDSKTLENSGAVNVEDFLKQRLTMNTIAQTNAQDFAGFKGNTSTINLRGLGADKTLILVNGRRMANVSINDGGFQTDLNGIPLSAIDRIEVLPSSASGIYGGSAIGGVVNVILKRDYSGGDVRLGFDNTWDADSPTRTVSATFGTALEDGRTHLMLQGSWSDAKSLKLQDRKDIYERNVATIQGRVPDYFYAVGKPWQGALPNIFIRERDGQSLLLDDGTSLNSPITFVGAGTSPQTSQADLIESLRTNAGSWNLDFPRTYTSPTGLLRPLEAAAEMKSFQVNLRRKMFERVELFSDLLYGENSSVSAWNPIGSTVFTVPANVSPFAQDVTVQLPDSTNTPINTKSASKSATLGALLDLPNHWLGELDYTWSENRYDAKYHFYDSAQLDADIQSGAVNPLVDTLLYPLGLERYLGDTEHESRTRLQSFSARASGPLPALPWGVAKLTIGVEQRVSSVPKAMTRQLYPYAIDFSSVETYYPRDSTTRAAYLESTAPLIKEAWLTGIHSLELQVSGRAERYQVDTGTSGERTSIGQTPPVTSYIGTTLNGEPFSSEASYTSTNYTIGFKYQPVPDVALRASRGTAFLPPAPWQLLKDPVQSIFQTAINDPVTGQPLPPVFTIGGGNPDLKPQSSKSLNLGLIWAPSWEPIRGLRINAEYYKIEQFDAIGFLDAQTIVNQESLYPGRVVRDESGTIVLVDTSSVNLFHRETEGWDFSLDYSIDTRIGRFGFRATESVIEHLKDQYAQTSPELEAAGYHPAEGGTVKNKLTATLQWDWRNWSAGWAARYFSSYKAYGAAGGPQSVQYANGEVADERNIAAQGSEIIPSQIYHDGYFGYGFGSSSQAGMGLLAGVTAQLGIRNVFNKAPPLDARYDGYFFLSPYGDAQLRSYWFNIGKQF